MHTALREAWEEARLTRPAAPLGDDGADVHPAVGFHVVPVLVYHPTPGPVTVVDESETAHVARSRCRAFVNPANRLMVYRTGADSDTPARHSCSTEMLVWVSLVT